MNLWITRLSQTEFSENEKSAFSQIIFDKFNTTFETFEYRAAGIHFLSYTNPHSALRDNYNHVQNEEILSYSGIIIDKNNSGLDFSNASVLANQKNDLSELAVQSAGQFALVEIRPNQFRCVVDTLGMYKVFYYRDSNNNLFISNHLSFIQAVKTKERNLDFLINFIVNGGTYGYTTIEKNVLTLPEGGEISWSTQLGYEIKQYLKIIELFKVSSNSHVENLAGQYQRISAYLTKYYDVLIPLSGGFDSRTILNMFWNRSTENISSYTYPDHPYDLSIAKKVAKKYGINHVELKPGHFPTIGDLHTFSLKSYPYICYSSIFKYLFHESSQKNTAGREIVSLLGNGGDTDLGINKFGEMKDISAQKAIEKLADKLINRTILTTEGYEQSRKNFSDHYSQKYAPLYEKVDSFNLSTAHFIFERFASYQGLKMSESFSYSSKIKYLPYSDKDFIQLIFSSDSDQLMRRKKGSIHHQLSDYLTESKAPRVPYTNSLHWNATKSDKAKYYLKRDYIDNALKKLNFMNDKYSSKVRSEFFNQNSAHFKEVIHSYPGSELWEHIDYVKVKNSAEEQKEMKLLFRIVPLLKEGI